VSLPHFQSDETAADRSRWFTEDVYTHDSSLKAYLRASFPAVRDVDDVVQESYLRVWKARLSRPIHSTKSFLFQVARHLAIDRVRRQRVAPVEEKTALSELLVTEEAPGAADACCASDEFALLAEAIHALPKRCRAVMVLRQIEGIPQKEVAARLGLSELTVQKHVVLGLRRCEKFLRRRGVKRTSP